MQGLADTLSRRRLGRFSARYSRFVGLMKVILPVSALVLAGAVAAWPYFAEGRRAFNLSFAAVGLSRSEGLEVIRPRYVGTRDGSETFTVTADRAIQPNESAEIMILEQPMGDMTRANGEWVALRAARGFYRRDSEQLDLAGAVSLYFDRGFELRAETARLDLGQGRAESEDPIEAQGPLGTLSADGFQLVEHGRRLYLNGRVNLVIYPPNQ